MSEPAQQWEQAFEKGTVVAMNAYHRIVARVFEPWSHDIVERLSPRKGSTVLDIACGPGNVSRLLAAAVGPNGRVLAADISPSMLAIAASTPSTGAPIEWIESPAAPLAVDSGIADGITCQQGLQFFPDQVAALAEMRRALAAGSRAIVSVWTTVEDQDIWGTLHASIAAAWSTDLADRYRGPFSLTGDVAAERARAAGFSNVELERVTLPVKMEGGAPALMESLLAAGIGADYAKLDEEGRAKLLDEITRRSRHMDRDGVLHGTLTASVLTLS